MLNLPALYDFCAQVTIQGKDGGFTSLTTLYDTQRYFFEQIARMLEDGIHEAWILKGRQEGISTANDVLDLYYPQTVTGLNGLLVSDDDENRDYRRDVIRQMHDSLPKDYKWPLRLDNRGALAWAKPNGSRLMFASTGKRVGTGGRAQLGKSKGLNYIHGDEVGSWRDDKAIDKLQASCSDEHPMRLYLYNSTAEGFGPFKTRYDVAKRSLTQRAMFIGPWLHTKYRVPRTNTEAWDRYGWELTRDELDMMSHVKADYDFIVPPEYVVWRRQTLVEKFAGDEMMMLQEYPNVPEDAFQAFGERFIPLATLKHLRHRAAQVVAPKGYDYDWAPHIEDLRIHDADPATAELRVWEERDPEGMYVVSAHPARASHPNATLNVCYVWRAYRETLEQVAEYVSEDVEMYRFAWACLHLAGAYRGKVPCFFLQELQMTGEYVWREIKRIVELGRGFGARPSGELAQLVRPWASIVNSVYRRSDNIGGATGAFHMRTTLQQSAWLMTALKNEAERHTLVIRSPAAIDELAWLRRGEAGDYDAVTTEGERRAYGRAHAIALGVEAWLNDAWPYLARIIPARVPTGPTTMEEHLLRTFLKRTVLAPPPRVRPTRVTAWRRMR